MDIEIPPLELKIMLESNPLKSRILARRLAVSTLSRLAATPKPDVRAAGKPERPRVPEAGRVDTYCGCLFSTSKYTSNSQ